MVDVGERLKKERGRLNFNQADFGEKCGVKRGTQLSYEQNKNNPDSLYLTKAHKLGADVTYILTGARVRKLVTDIDEEEEQALDSVLYMHADDEEAGARVNERGAAYSKNINKQLTYIGDKLVSKDAEDTEKIKTALYMAWQHKNYTEMHINDVINTINKLTNAAATVERDEKLLLTGMKKIMDEIERANIDYNETTLAMLVKTYINFKDKPGVNISSVLRAIAESQVK